MHSSFTGLAAGSHLAVLVEKLMGPPVLVHAANLEITKLSGSEPEAVFDAIWKRILKVERNSGEPNGVEGMIALVKAHPTLQRRMLDRLRDLPVAKLGAWIALNSGTCFTDTVIRSEFQEVLKIWCEQTENKVLRYAALVSAKLNNHRLKERWV
jgi:hypothetical protein